MLDGRGQKMLPFLFPSGRSAKSSTRAVQYILEKYRKLTGISHLTAHSLRHSFCHELVTRKIPLDVVARLTGHMKNDGSPNLNQTLVYT
jgi:integrase/recombinase XerC/integrase/recombinase XerD